MKLPLAYMTVAAATLAVMTAASLPDVALDFGAGVLAVKTTPAAYAGDCAKDADDGKWVLKANPFFGRKRYEMRKNNCDAEGNSIGYTLYVYWPNPGFSYDHWAMYTWQYVWVAESESWDYRQIVNRKGTAGDFPAEFPERPK